MREIKVGDKTFEVTIADDEESRTQGLQGVPSLEENEGMLFVFEEAGPVSFWMKDTSIPLDIVYIDAYGEVTQVFQGEPNSEEMLEGVGVKYVLEVNQGSGIQMGDECEGLPEEEDWEVDDGGFDDEDEIPLAEEGDTVPETKMVVIGPKGESQMELKGGERIFSRGNTKTLVRMAKRAWKSKSESDYKALGKRVFKYLDIQNNKEDDFVELPSK